MVISIWRKRRSDTLLGYRNPQAEIVHLLFPVSLIGLTYGREMSYTHGRDITLEGWLVHTSQANVKGTIKEHRNPILESRCKSKRGMESRWVDLWDIEKKMILIRTSILKRYPYSKKESH